MRGGGNRTLRFDVHFRDFDKNYVDLGATGPTVGDLLVFQDTLFDPVSHQQAGIEGGSCAITGVQNEFRTHCVGASPSPAGRSASGFGDRCSGQASCGRRSNRQDDQGASGTLTLVENGDGTRTGQDDGTGQDSTGKDGGKAEDDNDEGHGLRGGLQARERHVQAHRRK